MRPSCTRCKPAIDTWLTRDRQASAEGRIYVSLGTESFPGGASCVGCCEKTTRPRQDLFCFREEDRTEKKKRDTTHTRQHNMRLFFLAALRLCCVCTRDSKTRPTPPPPPLRQAFPHHAQPPIAQSSPWNRQRRRYVLIQSKSFQCVWATSI